MFKFLRVRVRQFFNYGSHNYEDIAPPSHPWIKDALEAAEAAPEPVTTLIGRGEKAMAKLLDMAKAEERSLEALIAAKQEELRQAKALIAALDPAVSRIQGDRFFNNVEPFSPAALAS